LAKNGDRCLATKDPLKYCNGVYSYSSKDPGSGVEYVIINEEKQWIGFELEQDYIDIAQKRIDLFNSQPKLF
jgi:hypothetical protein